ncbi:MAG: repair protein RecN [Evtepia sp.]|jgi:DNA repair protein RecN (Recombination protein N)|nr:repair protein RecN [Evtepia sp.]
MSLLLSLLHIENIALIESADISFGNGLNVLTGETGAGKSIVLDAISAIMGERVSRDLIRTGEKTALVSGVFCHLPKIPWFEEMGIYPDENGELSITRQMMADGKNICRVGGIPCTAVQLRALGRQLVNIHGQHDSQQLLDERSHLSYLDNFGGLEVKLTEFRTSYDQLMELRRAMDALVMDETERSRRIDTLQYQIQELQRAGLRTGEVEELTERRELLRNSGKLMDAVERAYLALSGDEEKLGANALLAEAERALSSVSAIANDIEAAANHLAELRYTADDMAEQVRDLRDRFEFSPDELDQVESRLDTLYRLNKKYGGTTEEMLNYLGRCREELEQIEMADDTILRLEKECHRQRKEAEKRAEQLSLARRETGKLLQEKIEEELRQLDMPKVQFRAELRPKTGEFPMDQTGMDDLQFFMSANLGESLKPIQKVASGGELARIMLALKNVLAENDLIATLIFDEVDAGISGRAAQKVAEKMGKLASCRQILCVTHLAQIAAMADLHFSVQKGERENRTHTVVTQLSTEERELELARLTGGSHVSDAILQGAKELLKQADQLKNHGHA